jgi:hypothetical protein
MLAGMRDRGHAAVGVQLASLDRQTSASRTPRPYTIVVLIYARRSCWLAGWLAGWRAGSFMAVKSTISVRAYSRAESLYSTVIRYM